MSVGRTIGSTSQSNYGQPPKSIPAPFCYLLSLGAFEGCGAGVCGQVVAGVPHLLCSRCPGAVAAGNGDGGRGVQALAGKSIRHLPPIEEGE